MRDKGEEVETDERGSRRLLKQALIVGLGVAVLHIAFGPDILATLGTLYDDVVYLALGQSLATGEGYRSIHLVGSPVHVKFPPLLPMSFAAIWWLTGTLNGAVFGAYALSMLLLAMAASALWLYGRSLGIRWWLVAVFTLGPLLLLRTVRYFAGAVSEPWFLAGWAIALLLVDRLGSHKGGSRSYGAAALLGLVLAATALARTQAVMLIPAMLGALVVRGVSLRVIATGAGAAFVPIAAWEWAHRRMMAAGPLSPSLDQSSYLDWILGGSFGETLGSLALAARVNPPNYLLHAATLLVGWSSWKAQAVVLVGVGLTILGMCWSARRRPELALSVAAVVTVLVFWPFNQSRFLTTLVPVAGLAAAYAVNRLYRASPKSLQRASLVGCAFLVVSLGIINARIRRNTYAYQASEGSLPVGVAAATAWIELNTDPADHLLADYSAVYFLRTGRQTSIGFPEQPFTLPSWMFPEGRFLARQLLADSVDYVIDARPSEQRIGIQVESIQKHCPAVLEPIAPLPTSELAPRYYRVTRDEECLLELANSQLTG